MKTRPFVALALLLALAGCQEPAGDAEHDSFARSAGAADAFGVAEESCEAVGALAVANEADEATLLGDVRLTSRATANLLEARPVDTLEALDAVPWIGPVSFGRILDQARAEGRVTACEEDRVRPAASGFSITVVATADGEGFDPDYGDWTYDEDEWEYRHELTTEVDELPFRHSNGDLSVYVSEDGRMSLDYTYGDADGGADARAIVPLEVPAGTRYVLEMGGGDYASGAWSVNATVTLEVR